MNRQEATVRPIKSPLSRRVFLLSGAAAVTAMRAMPATPGCSLVSEQEEGPFYVNAAKLRPDVTEGRPGVPLRLRIALVDAKKCTPLENAAVDIWHCDAVGVYSGFTATGSGGGGGRGPGGRGPMDETRFLRGVQLTGAQWIVDFTTCLSGLVPGAHDSHSS